MRRKRYLRMRQSMTLRYGVISLLILVAAIVVLSGGALAAMNGFFPRMQDRIILEQDGIRIEAPGVRDQEAFLRQEEQLAETGAKLAYNVLGHEQKTVSFSLEMDGYYENITYPVIWKNGRVTPVYTPGANDYAGNLLTRIGDSNRFVLEHTVNLYVVDFDRGTLEAFLPDEVDGIRYSDLAEKSSELDNQPRWASSPHVSPDGSILLYQTDRGEKGGVRIYNFNTGEDKWLAQGYNVAGGAVWIEKESVVVRHYDEDGFSLNKIFLSDGKTEKICTLYGLEWDGVFPWLLCVTKDHTFTCLNLQSGESSVVPIEGSVLRFSLNQNAEHSIAAILEYRDNEYVLQAFDTETGEFWELYRIANAFSYSIKHFKWTSDNSFLLAGTDTKNKRDETVEFPWEEVFQR